MCPLVSFADVDSAGNQVIEQEATAVRQRGGMLQYEAGPGEGAATYNTLSTPRGGQFQVRLPDGSRVWLNAASALRYPVAFNGKERLVEITGEGYFEIAKNAQQPFKVRVNNRATIEVLGTSFNVKAYPDESCLQATLISGTVNVKTGKESHLLQPGRMAAVQADATTVISTANIMAVTAWKNGKFWFDNADIPAVMQQLSRWYDIQVRYEGAVSKELFSGDIERSLPLSKVLTILAQSGIRYRMEGRLLIIY